VIKIRDWKPVWNKERKSPFEFGTEFVHQNSQGWMTEKEIASIKACAERCENSTLKDAGWGTTYEERRNTISPKLPTVGVLSWSIFASRLERHIYQEQGKVSTKKKLPFLPQW